MTDLATAMRERADGMERALDHAERETLGWGDLALAFLHRYAKRNACFISEDVSDASREYGLIQPPTDRAWGSVYVRASRLGMIKRVGYSVSRRRHCSPCPLWESQIYA